MTNEPANSQNQSIFLTKPPKIEVPTDTIFSAGGFTYLLPQLIGRDLINDKFKAVGLEGNVDSLINIAKNRNMDLESILKGVSEEGSSLISSKKREHRINFITNKDSLQIFENVKSGLDLDDEAFYSLGKSAITKSPNSFVFLRAMDFNIFEVANNVGIVNNLKNKTKDFQVSINDIEEYGESQYVQEISLKTKPKIGIEHPNYLIYWNAGMQDGIASKCRGVDPLSGELEIDEFTKEFTLKYKLTEDALPHKSPSLKSKLVRKFYEKKLEKLIEDGKTVEIEKKFLTGQVMAETDTVLAMMNQMRHPDTYKHQIRVTYMGLLFGKQMGLSNEDLNVMATAYPNHDNKKNATPESVLHLEGRPSNDEMIVIKAHAPLGEVAQLESGAKPEVAIICSEHQGRANGSEGGGYPETIPVFNLNGEIIDYRAPTWKETTHLGNISQLVDATDAIHCKRVYKPTIPLPNVQRILDSDIERGIIQEDLGNFYVNNTLETLIEIGYDETKFYSGNYDFIKYGSEKEKEMVSFILGYNDNFTVDNIPAEIRNLNQNHRIQIESKEDRIHNIGNYLAKLYSQLEDNNLKVLFKRPLDDNLRKYLPDDGIEAI